MLWGTLALARAERVWEFTPKAAWAAGTYQLLAATHLEDVCGNRVGEPFEVALADEGSLWDPLPLTLPTYVGKATARRTVRTIELTGITSSGHDEADTELARRADEDADRAALTVG